jgi:hypothetical protein
MLRCSRVPITSSCAGAHTPRSVDLPGPGGGSRRDAVEHPPDQRGEGCRQTVEAHEYFWFH